MECQKRDVFDIFQNGIKMILKKFLLIFVFVSLPLFAFSDVGLGGAFSYNLSTSPTSAVSFTARSDESPWCIFLNAHLKNNTITVFADDWFINERIATHLDYFVLWGISAGFSFNENFTDFGTGCRFGGGLDFFFFERHLVSPSSILSFI